MLNCQSDDDHGDGDDTIELGRAFDQMKDEDSADDEMVDLGQEEYKCVGPPTFAVTETGSESELPIIGDQAISFEPKETRAKTKIRRSLDKSK